MFKICLFDKTKYSFENLQPMGLANSLNLVDIEEDGKIALTSESAEKTYSLNQFSLPDSVSQKDKAEKLNLKILRSCAYDICSLFAVLKLNCSCLYPIDYTKHVMQIADIKSNISLHYRQPC